MIKPSDFKKKVDALPKTPVGRQLTNEELAYVYGGDGFIECQFNDYSDYLKYAFESNFR